MEKEIWKPIEVCNGKYYGLYEVSNLGRVKSLERIIPRKGSSQRIKESIKAHTFNTNGYPCVSLCKDKKSRLMPIHRLVATAFIPNPQNKPCVDHINANVTDFSIENLRWVTHKENMNNPISKERINKNSHTKEALLKSKRKKIEKGGKTAPKKVYQYTLEGEFVSEYESAAEAHRAIGVHAADIRSACNGSKISAGRFLWTRNPMIKPKYTPYSKKNKKIIQLNKDGDVIREWNSITEAALSLDLCMENISKCAKGDSSRRFCGGYMWKYANIKTSHK